MTLKPEPPLDPNPGSSFRILRVTYYAGSRLPEYIGFSVDDKKTIKRENITEMSLLLNTPRFTGSISDLFALP